MTRRRHEASIDLWPLTQGGQKEHLSAVCLLVATRVSVLSQIQLPRWFLAPLIAATTLSCKDLAQAGCGRFQPIKMPTQTQNRVDHMICSKAVRRREWDRDYGSFGPVRGSRFDEKSDCETEQGTTTATESRGDMIQAPSGSRCRLQSGKRPSRTRSSPERYRVGEYKAAGWRRVRQSLIGPLPDLC